MSTRDELGGLLDQIDPEQTAAYGSLVDIANRILDMIEDEDREMTLWEKANLSEAAGELVFRRLRLAWVALQLAEEEPHKVAQDAVQPTEAKKLADLSLRDCRKAFAYLSASRAMLHIFGLIIGEVAAMQKWLWRGLRLTGATVAASGFAFLLQTMPAII